MPAKSPARSGRKESFNGPPKEKSQEADAGDFDNSVIFVEEVAYTSPPDEKPSQRRTSRSRQVKPAAADQVQPESPKPTAHLHRNEEGGKCYACGQDKPVVEEQDHAPVPNPPKDKPVKQMQLKKTATENDIKNESEFEQADPDQPLDESRRAKIKLHPYESWRCRLIVYFYALLFAYSFGGGSLGWIFGTMTNFLPTVYNGHVFIAQKNVTIEFPVFSHSASLEAGKPAMEQPAPPELATSAQNLKESSHAPVTPTPAQPVSAATPAVVSTPVTPTPPPTIIRIENVVLPVGLLQTFRDEKLEEIKGQLAQLLAAQKPMQVKEEQSLDDLKKEYVKLGEEDVTTALPAEQMQLEKVPFPIHLVMEINSAEGSAELKVEKPTSQDSIQAEAEAQPVISAQAEAGPTVAVLVQ